MNIAEMLLISQKREFDIAGALKWSAVSIAYVFVLFVLFHLAAKIFGTGKVYYRDDLNVAKNYIFTFIFGVIISPILETLFIILLYKLFNKFKFNYPTTWLLVTIIFSLAHLTRSWTVVSMVIIMFQIQQYYLSVRVKYANFNVVWLEGTIMHTMHNCGAFIFAYYKMQPT